MRFYPTAISRSAFSKYLWQCCSVSANLFKVIGPCNHFSDYWQINSNWRCCFGRRVKRAALATKNINMNYSSSQIGLLYLCKYEPGPSVNEMFEYGSSYGLQYQSIFNDYIFLLSNKMVWPVGFIEKETFLPTHCLLSEKGEKILSDVFSNNPNLIPDRSSTWDFPDKDYTNNIMQEHLTKFESMKNETIQNLADSYNYWATLGNDGKLRIPDDQLFYAAARGSLK